MHVRRTGEAWMKAGKFDGQPHAELAPSKAQLETERKPGTENCACTLDTKINLVAVGQ